MKKLTQILIVTVLSLFGFTSCVKPGCTDEKATNYSAEAKEDDGTCTYRGDITFWCLPAVSEMLYDMGHTRLRFELEGEILDSVDTEFFFAPSGECSAPGVKTIAMNELPYEYRYYKYRVKGSGFATIWEDFIRLDANDCLDIQLKFE